MKLFYWLANFFEFIFRGRNTTQLADWLGMSRSELFAIRPAYREFEVVKKSGGHRTIHAPMPELKIVQRLILRRLLRNLRSHDAAVGFERGKSIVTGARQHTGQAVVLRFDIVDFFPSIQRDKVYAYFRVIGWNRRAAKLLTQLVTHCGHLPQGAPTSPRLSNLVNYRMDDLIQSLVDRYDGNYSRYADDITISLDDSDCDLKEIIDVVFRTVRWMGYRPHMGKKLNISRRGQRQSVNGLVVNETVNLPREKRRWLRSVKHRAQSNWGWTDPKKPNKPIPVLQPTPEISREEFQGWLAFEKMIESQNDPPMTMR